MITDETLAAYHDGVADPEAALRVEASLARDSSLRARLNAMQTSDDGVKAAFDQMLSRPVPDHLIEMIRAAKIPTAADNVVAFAPIVRTSEAAAAQGPAWRNARRWVGWAVAAQLGLIAIGAALFTPKAEDARYHALGAAPAPATANAMVMFRPETTERDLREALLRVDAVVVGGPTSAGAWLLRIPEARRSANLEILRRRSDIVLAQPVDSGSAR